MSVVVVLVHTWKLWLLTLQRAIVNQATTSIHISQHGRFKVLVVAPGRLHKLLPVPLAATATAVVTSAPCQVPLDDSQRMHIPLVAHLER